MKTHTNPDGSTVMVPDDAVIGEWAVIRARAVIGARAVNGAYMRGLREASDLLTNTDLEPEDNA